MLTLAKGLPSRRSQTWGAQTRGRESVCVECLNRKERRERMRKPGKYHGRRPRTAYPTVGEDGKDGRRLDLVDKTTGLKTGMAVTWLGTSSGAPTLLRNVSSIVLRLPEETFLFDAGEGTQTQLLKSDIFPASIKKIFITHLHGDHCFGLPGLLSMINELRLFNDRGEMMYIYGPPGLGDFIRMSLPHWFDRLRMSITVVEFSLDPCAETQPRSISANGNVFLQQMPPTAEAPIAAVPNRGRRNSIASDWRRGMDRRYQWRIDAADGLTVTASQLQHRIPCWGYVIQEADSNPSQWEVDLWKKQQLGNGVLAPNDITDEAAHQVLACKGRKVVILGDTCNSDTILSAGRGADLVSHEATFSSDMKDKALRSQHSTATMAGTFAKRLGAKKLVLTHFSPRYRRGAFFEYKRGKDVERLVLEAQEAFGRDNVIAAEDFTTCDIPLNNGIGVLGGERAVRSA